jgi:transcriptional regulator
MYQPAHFKVEDRERLHAAIRTHSLGLLITAGPGGLMANAVPFLLVLAGDNAYLRCHVARPNAQWREIAAGAAPLVVFQGPDGYVTPSWYATKRETGKVVPTWNYLMVQVRGKARAIEDEAWLAEQIRDLTHVHESARTTPWAVSDAPADFVRAQIKGIVGIEIEIAEIAGKWKMSQNRNEADWAGVVAGFSGEETAKSADLAALMAGERR